MDRTTAENDSDARIAVLVHGLFDSPLIFFRLAHRLKEAGWTAHAVRLRPNSARPGLDRLAQQLKIDVEQKIPANQRIDLIGFSMGGLVARYYLQRLGGMQRTRRLITISSPHLGSRTARFLPNTGGRQMRPGSAFLKDLNSDVHMLESLDPVSLWSPWDLVVRPPANAILPIGQSIKVGIPLHSLMILSRRSIDRVVEVLR